MTAQFIYTGIIAPATVLLPLGAGIYAWSHLGKPERLIWCFLIIGGLTDLAASYTAHRHVNNLWLSHIYTPIETLFFMTYYYWVIKDKRTKRAILVGMVVYPLFCVVNALFFQSIKIYNTYTLYPEVLILLYLGIVCFVERSDAPVAVRGTAEASLPWINASILIYMGGSFFYYLYYNFFKPHVLMIRIVTDIHSGLLIIMYVCIMIGFLRCRK